MGGFTFRVAQILKSSKSRKSSGEDKIPSKLVSLAGNRLTNTLITAVSCTFRNIRFPNDVKKRGSLAIR